MKKAKQKMTAKIHSKISQGQGLPMLFTFCKIPAASRLLMNGVI